MHMRKSVLGILSLLAILGLAGPAHALTVSGGTCVIPMTLTDWTSELGFFKFDPSLGTLTDIKFVLEGTAQGYVRIESLDTGPTHVTTDLGATITMYRPGPAAPIVVTMPAWHGETDLAPADGTPDFAGPSGKSWGYTPDPMLSAYDFSIVHSSAPADLALFTGVGPSDVILLPTDAKALFSANGSGNLLTQSHSEALARGTIEYTYETGRLVPEPSSLALLFLGGGVMALGAIRRLRK
jgi:hypothetical protein